MEAVPEPPPQLDAASSSGTPARVDEETALRQSPVTWVPEGEEDSLRWKKRRTDDAGSAADASHAAVVLPARRQDGMMTAKLKNNMLDREVPYHEIPAAQRELHHEAERK